MSGLGNYTSDARDFWKKGMQGGRIGPILDCSQSTASSHKAKLKVYSRRTREGPTKGSIINEGDSSRFLFDHGDNHNSKYHTSTASQSLADSTSEYLDSDGDLEMLA